MDDNILPSIFNKDSKFSYLSIYYEIERVFVQGIDKSFLLSFLLFWLFIEMAFFILIKKRYMPLIQTLTKPPPSPLQPKELFLRIFDDLDTLNTYSFEEFLSRWFLNANINNIRRGNIAEFLAWALWQKRTYDLNKEQWEELETMIEHIEERYNHKIDPGYHPDVDTVTMTLDPIEVVHRPLFFYILIGLSRYMTRAYFWLRGFTRHDFYGIKYWYKPAPSISSNNLEPIVFFHGISTGLFAYSMLLTKLCLNRTSILIEFPSIAMKLHLDVPSDEKMMKAVDGILNRHGISKACFVGHSYGTFLVSWANRFIPERIQQIVLIDPCAILLHLPDVAFNFLYRKPSNFVENVIFWIASRELGISHVLRRHFWWHRNILWLKDVNCPMVVALSGSDEVLPSKAVHEYIHLWKEKKTHGEIEVLWWDDFSHGQMLFVPSAQYDLVARITIQEKQHIKRHKSIEYNKEYDKKSHQIYINDEINDDEITDDDIYGRSISNEGYSTNFHSSIFDD